MITGPDVSKYQTIWAIEDGHLFAILNHEDPTCSDKIDRCISLGIPYAFYGWLYPGEGGNTASRMKAHSDLLALNGDPTPKFFWLDYEQSGVTPEDLRQGLERAYAGGYIDLTGVYTYLSVVASVHPVFVQYQVPLWLAYYPFANDGTLYLDQAINARQWEAVIWQYTSGHLSPTGERVDMNVVLDEQWYQQTMGGEDLNKEETRAEIDAWLTEDTPYGRRIDNLIEAYINGEVTIPGTAVKTTRFQIWLLDNLQKLKARVKSILA